MKRLTDTERARRYARKIGSTFTATRAYLAGLRMGRKLEREKQRPFSMEDVVIRAGGGGGAKP